MDRSHPWYVNYIVRVLAIDEDDHICSWILIVIIDWHFSEYYKNTNSLNYMKCNKIITFQALKMFNTFNTHNILVKFSTNKYNIIKLIIVI